jgi:protein TonB
MTLRAAFLALAFAAAPLSAAAQTPEAPSSPRWIERPTGNDFARAYPRRALRRGIEARVVIACTINAEGRLQNCTIDSEEPAGHGFDEAALEVSRKFRMSQTMENGATTEGGTVRIPLFFRLN